MADRTTAEPASVPREPTSGSRSLTLAAGLVTSLFFTWGLTNNLLPVLIPKLKKACQLTDFESAFVDVANWMAYFLMAIPTALLMRRFGYKAGVVAGLAIAAAGCFFFVPAADVHQFWIFLAALFVTATGMVFLETAANPYMTVLGDPRTAERRLNFAQAVNGVAAFISSLWLAKLILSRDSLTVAEIAALPEAQRVQELIHEAQMVKPPYIVIGIGLAAMALLFLLVHLPDIKSPTGTAARGGVRTLLHERHLVLGVLALFFYVGAQVGVDSFFIRYTTSMTGLTEYDAATYLGLILGCFMLGRIVGTSLMSVVRPHSLMTVYAAGNIVLLGVAVTIPSGDAGTVMLAIPRWLGLGPELVLTRHLAPYLIMGVKFFMSIMFPTIFSLAIRGLGERTKLASSWLVMSIVGGALFPLTMGRISDMAGSMQMAYWVPLLCMIPVFLYGAWGHRVRTTEA